MLRKVVLGTLLVGLIGVLVAGAVIRTIDKTGNVAKAQGLGQGHGAGGSADWDGEAVGTKTSASTQGNGRGGNGSAVDRQYPNYTSELAGWTVIEGEVAQAPSDGVDLVVTTAAGEDVVIGAGPGYMEQVGFALQASETVQVRGYWEDGEFKAVQVTRLSDGQTVALRDEMGRPAWAGGGRNAQAVSRGNSGSAGSALAPGDGTATGQAEVDAWLSIEGTVTSVDADALVLATTAGEEIVVENRPWWFAQDIGFTAQPGDQVSLVGFYENDAFEAGQIGNLSSGQTVSIREESGRPRWAGGGRRGG